MSESSLQTAPSPVAAIAAPTTDKKPLRKNPFLVAAETLGSLRLTVTLFALSLVLVFFGTLAQIDAGIFTVMKEYFRSFFVMMPVQLLVKFGQIFVGLPKSLEVSGAIPFPGGFTLGVLLLINLTCAYGTRLPTYLKHWKNYSILFGVLVLNLLVGYLAVTNFGEWMTLFVLLGIIVFNFLGLFSLVIVAAAGTAVSRWEPVRKIVLFPGNRFGIFTLHIGIVVMLAGEFITAATALEGNMVIEEGETSNAVLHNRLHEIAIVDPSGKDADEVTVVPARLINKTGKLVKDERLPFDLEVERWMVNSKLEDVSNEHPNLLATAGRGLKEVALEESEVSGVAEKQSVDTPSVYVTLSDRDGKNLGTYLLSVLLPEQKIAVGGKSYNVSLRFKHTYKPYSLELQKFTFDRYQGTQIPKNFASRVVLRDQERGDEGRELTIRMNDPLRHRGDTLFQADWNKKTERGTVLQVVRNPAWQLPYWSCAIVTLGMLMHFGINLLNFLGRRAGE